MLGALGLGSLQRYMAVVVHQQLWASRVAVLLVDLVGFVLLDALMYVDRGNTCVRMYVCWCVSSTMVCTASLPVLCSLDGLSRPAAPAAHSYSTPTPAYLPDTVDKQLVGQ